MPNRNWFHSIVFIFLLWIPVAWPLDSSASAIASETVPLVRAPDVSPEVFEAYAKANGRKPYSSFLDEGSLASSEALSRLVERAQEAWIDSSTSVARTLFERIADLALENDWREPEREAIQYALLRLAQISAPGAEQDLWIEKAVAFDWDHRPDPSLFPPPLLERFHAAREKMMKGARSVRFDKILPEHLLIRINGRRIRTSDRMPVLVPAGRFRVSAYSDSLPAITEKLETEQILALSPGLKPLISGNCEEPAGGEGALGRAPAFDALFENHCLRRRHAIGWMKEGDTPTSGDSKPLTANWPITPIDSSSSGRMTKRSWIWIGVSALVAGAAYYVYNEQQKQSSSPQVQPVHRQGY